MGRSEETRDFRKGDRSGGVFETMVGAWCRERGGSEMMRVLRLSGNMQTEPSTISQVRASLNRVSLDGIYHRFSDPKVTI